MNPAFPRREAVLSVSAAHHPSSQAAASRLLAEGYEVSVFGTGAEALAATWRQHGMEVDVCEDLSHVPAIAVLGPGEARGDLTSPNLLWVGASDAGPLAGGRGIDNLESWVDDYLAPRVPRFPRLG